MIKLVWQPVETIALNYFWSLQWNRTVASCVLITLKGFLKSSDCWCFLLKGALRSAGKPKQCQCFTALRIPQYFKSFQNRSRSFEPLYSIPRSQFCPVYFNYSLWPFLPYWVMELFSAVKYIWIFCSLIDKRHLASTAFLYIQKNFSMSCFLLFLLTQVNIQPLMEIAYIQLQYIKNLVLSVQQLDSYLQPSKGTEFTFIWNETILED